MKYLSFGGMLYSLSDSEYRLFMTYVAEGGEIQEGLEDIAKELGVVENIDDMSAGEARAIVEAEGLR